MRVVIIFRDIITQSLFCPRFFLNTYKKAAFFRKNSHLLCAIAVGFLAAPPLAAQDARVIEVPGANFPQVMSDPILQILGYTPGQVTVELGAPIEIGSVRGSEPRLDSVYFFYEAERLYVYWFKNHVWQLRFDERSKASFLGLTMNMTKAQVIGILGKAIDETDNRLMFQLPDQGFPVRASLYFKENKLYDIYMYRSDL